MARTGMGWRGAAGPVRAGLGTVGHGEARPGVDLLGSAGKGKATRFPSTATPLAANGTLPMCRVVALAVEWAPCRLGLTAAV
jgi:hypothetical protein